MCSGTTSASAAQVAWASCAAKRTSRWLGVRASLSRIMLALGRVTICAPTTAFLTWVMREVRLRDAESAAPAPPAPRSASVG